MYFSETLRYPSASLSFAGAPGASPFSTEVREFLSRVRARPQDFKELLLTVTFHPDPMLSQAKVTIMAGQQPQFLQDAAVMNNLDPPGAFLNKLRRIRDDFQKRDTRFKQQIEAELQLRNDMIATAGEVAMRMARQSLYPLLLDALRTNALPFTLSELGRRSVEKILPPPLVQRLRTSAASDAHYTNLGSFLRRYGEVLQGKDAAFKALVEQERAKQRQQELEQEKRREQEKERTQRRPRRR
jgi:hypothetical protein